MQIKLFRQEQEYEDLVVKQAKATEDIYYGDRS